ncbi:MAG: outer membrane beta-barrel protein [Reyranellaceae bacterium]
MLAVALGASSVAVAQVPGAVGQPTQRPERPDDRPPAAVRQAENYTTKDIPVGSFRLYAGLEADQSFNDNIYATSPATGTVPAFIEVISPSFSLKSDWSNHMLNLFAMGRIGLYSIDSSLNNYQDVSVGGTGRFDIQRNSNVYGGASWNRMHEVIGAPNTPTAPGIPVTVFNLTSANVGYFQKFNRLSARLDGRFDNYAYQDNGLGPAQGVLPNTDRNRSEWREALRLGYEFTHGYEVWARGSLNQRRYFQTDSTVLDRSSNGFDFVAGVLLDFGSITSMELFAGYMQQNYVSGQFGTISAPTFGLRGYWNPMHDLMVKPFVRRVVEDSAFINSAAFISTSAGLDINYLMRPNIQIDSHASYAIADYTATSGGTPGTPYEQYVTLRIGAVYFPTENFYVGPSYQFIHRTSNQFNSNYNQNLIMIRMGARL